MVLHTDYGKLGEDKAVAYLEQCGYIILERNWRLRHKEIDVICTDGTVIVVVEVKARHLMTERPEELINYRKRQNLLQGAEAYLRWKGIQKELRFDLILVVGKEMKVQHIIDAIQVFD